MTALYTTSSAVSPAELNKALTTDGTLGLRCLTGRIRYTGSAWEVVSATSKTGTGLISANLTWSTNQLQISLSSTYFANPPVVQVTPSNAGSVPIIKAVASSNTLVVVTFHDAADTQITVQATTMDFNVLILGT